MDKTAGSLKLSDLDSEAGSISFSGGGGGPVLIFVQIQNPRVMSFTFTLMFSGNITIDWGDGHTQSAVSGGSNTHNYGFIGEYTISLSGDVQNIHQLYVVDQLMSNIVLPNINIVSDLNCSTNLLTTPIVSDLIINLDQNGQTDGTVITNNQAIAAPLNAEGLLAKASLESKGWTVTVDA